MARKRNQSEPAKSIVTDPPAEPVVTALESRLADLVGELAAHFAEARTEYMWFVETAERLRHCVEELELDLLQTERMKHGAPAETKTSSPQAPAAGAATGPNAKPTSAARNSASSFSAASGSGAYPGATLHPEVTPSTDPPADLVEVDDDDPDTQHGG